MDDEEIVSKHDKIVNRLKELANSEAVAGMARYGIDSSRAYGVSIPNLRTIARETGKSHDLAEMLWKSGIDEARILASMIEEPSKLTSEQMERWETDFDSWDICDQCCNNLFRKSTWAHGKAVEWTSREEEFVKRAGFTLAACLAVHDKPASDEEFLKFLPLIKRASTDGRNFVKKAVNWALRQIGKRNAALNRAAIEMCREIQELDSKAARWIASDALRELTGDKVQERLQVARGINNESPT